MKDNNLKVKSGFKLIRILFPLKFYLRGFKTDQDFSNSLGNVLTSYFGFI